MKQNLDAAYWTERYKRQETGWDLGEVSRPLKEYIDQLNDKHLAILIPGAGNAYEAGYLLHKGFRDITVCDLSAVPLENLRERSANAPALKLVQEDFFNLSGQFDLILEQTFFCALDPSLRQAYFSKMSELLKTGGTLAGVLFDDALNTDHPPFGGSRGEYLRYIPETLQIVKFEKCYNSITPRAGRELFMLLKKIKAGDPAPGL